MAIEVVCDDCGNKYRISDDKAGTRVRCRECGARIDVPEDEVETEIISRPKSKGGKKKSKGSDGPPIALIIGGIAVVAIIGILAVVFTRGGGNQVAQNPPPLPVTPQFPAPNPLPGQIPASTLPTSPMPSTLPGTLPVSPQVASNNPAPVTPPANALPQSPLPNMGAPVQGKGFAAAAENEAAGNPGGPAEVPAGLNPNVWNVKVDPAPAGSQIEAGKSLGIRFPNGSSNRDIVYPITPSSFVALGTNGFFGGTREIYNLSTRGRIGQIQGKGFDEIAALSPDGKYFAAQKKSGGQTSVVVWETKSGKELGTLDVPGGHFGLKGIFFPSPTRLAALTNEGFKGGIKTWKIPEGEPELEFPVPAATDLKEIGVSPGGQYLAAVTEKHLLKIFDLATAEAVGELPLIQNRRGGGDDVDAISFSPDGSEFALIMREGGDHIFMRFATSDAKLLAMSNLKGDSIHFADRFQTNRLEWFPDKRRLLWRGHFVIDAQLGGPVWNAPEESGSSDSPRLLVGDENILIAFGGSNANLKLVKVPIEQIEAAAKTVAAGGEASDAGMPPITKGDISSASIVTPAASIDWTMKPDPAPAGKPLKNAIALPVKDRPFVGGGFISRADAARAAIWYTDDGVVIIREPGIRTQTQGKPAGGPGTIMIDSFDLSNGKMLKPLTIPYQAVVQSMSPDGDFIGVRTLKPNEQRLDVYQLSTGKPVVGWRPYANEADDNHKGVASTFLIDGEYCLTQNLHPVFRQESASTYMWKLPECKAIYRLPAVKNVTLSPGGKYIGCLADNKYVFLEARTGELVGEVTLPFPNMSCAFHPVGTHLAILAADSVSHQINIIDIATGKVTADFYVPEGSETVQWSGDASLLLDGIYLVDLTQKKIGWKYQLPSGIHLKTQPDLTHWMLIGNGNFPNQVMLSNARLPEKAVQDKITATQIPDNSLLKPGMQVGLQVNLGAQPPDRPNLAKEVYDHFKTGLEKNGFTVVQGVPTTFTITTTMSSNGNAQEFRVRGAVTSVPSTKVDCEVALLVNGQVAWKNVVPATNQGGFIEFTQGDDIGTHLTKRMWSSVVSHLTNFTAPVQIFGNNAGNGLGTSILVPGGAQMQR